MGSINKLKGNDVTNVNSVSSEGKRKDDIYDIYGHKCTSVSKPGIYLINGKKKAIGTVK